MATTLQSLIDQCKQQSDNVGQSFVTDPEWGLYINNSYAELYGRIVTAFGNDYFTQSPSSGFIITTDGINDHFALPTDFFKLLGADLQVSAPNYWVTLRPFQFAERNRLSIFNNLIPMAGQTVRLKYVPRLKPLLLVTDAVDGVNGWEEFIIIDACIKALAKEESDVSVLLTRKAAMEERLNGEVENRDAGSPARVADVQARRARAMQYRLDGNNLWLIGNGMPGYAPQGDWGDPADFGGW